MQAVIVERDVSEFLTLEDEVPQGSILGLLLFIIYTREFRNNISFSKCHFYADDKQIYLPFPEVGLMEANTQVNSDLEYIISISEKFGSPYILENLW